ncbi:MAG: biotin/lipoyl-containing protein, partial [candidate division NC10 bacterium]
MAITKVVMPKLSEAMETGKVIKWLKQEGERVEGGEIIAEIETDKADIELEAFGAGLLRKILVPAGETVPVGELIGVIADPGDDIANLLVIPSPPTAPPPRAASAPAPAAAAGVEAGEAAARGAEGRIKASPLARKIAARSGVDLALVEGSGPGGRIIRRDVEATAQGSEEPGKGPARGPAPLAGVPTGRAPAADAGEAPARVPTPPV